MKSLEHAFERGLFSSRWLLAPFYAGLVGALLLLLVSFMQELWHLTLAIPQLEANAAVLGVLSLIDLVLAGNLVIIVIFSGYENFVSKLDIGKHEDLPAWKGAIDFAALKLKLVASIVAISGIHLLKVFMEIDKVPDRHVMWMVIIHAVFVLSCVLLALMDRISTGSAMLKKKDG